MAKLYLKDNDKSYVYLESEIGYLNAKENCPFVDHIKYELDSGETFVSIEKISGSLPLGLFDNGPVTVDGEFLSIQGTPAPLDSYHKIKDYTHSIITSNSDDYIPYSDVYEQIENLEDLKLMTVGFLKNSTGHYSGRDYGIKGHLAYVMDNGNGIEEQPITINDISITIGDEILTIGSGSDTVVDFSFVIRLTYLDVSMSEKILEKEFFIKTIINIDPEIFLMDYGDTNHSLKHDNGEILTPEEYIIWRNSQGHQFLSDCS